MTLQSLLTSFATDIMELAAICLLFAAVEARWPASDRRTLSSRIVNWLSVLILLAALSLLPLISSPFLLLLSNGGLLGVLFGNWRPDTLPGAIFCTVTFVVVWDFFQYWVHRAEHRFPSLWTIHRFHHEDDH